MSDEFEVNSEGYTSDGYRRLEPVALKSMYVGNLISVAVIAVVSILLYVYAPMISAPHEGLFKIALMIVAVVLYIYCIVSPSVFYRRYRYRIDGDKLEIRKGILVISHILVPVERIHQVQVSKGPINRMFGLANVNITTAGGTAVLQYLSESEAEGVAEHLNQYVVKILKERE